MKLKIYLFRHGATGDNSKGVFSGWRDVSLDEKGRRDAKIIALRLKDKQFALAFQSDMARSKETLKEVLKFHQNVRVITDARIKERSYGNLQGKTHFEAVKKYGIRRYDEWHRGWENRPPEGESLADVEKRVNLFIKELMKILKKERVNAVISAHGNSMRIFRKHFEKLTKKQTCTLYNDYEQVYEYEIEV